MPAADSIPSSTSSSRPRTPIRHRLQSLLLDSPRTSLDTDIDTDHSDDARTWFTSPGGATATESAPISSSPSIESVRTGSPTDLLQAASQLPIVRWFRGESSSLPVSRSGSPTSPSSALREAIDEELPIHARHSLDTLPPDFHLQRPPKALLSRQNMNAIGRNGMRRTPPFLDSLTRATLPTASVTKPLPVHRQQTSYFLPAPADAALRDHYDDIRSPAIDISHSPPSGNSIKTLQQLHERSRTSGLSSGHTRSFSTGSGPSRWWFGSRKAEVDNLLDDSDRAPTIEDEEAQHRAKYCAPKNPMVFCHGLLGFDSVQIGPSIAPMNVSHWRGIREVLEARGIEVLVTRVPATSSPIERAKVLEARVSEVYPGRSVHLIGHSMGGLDCRYLTTHLKDRKFNVLSITTVATPHRGSTFADHFLATVGKERFPQVMALLDLLPNGGGDGTAFQSLTIEAMHKFNEETPDVEGVKYYSWGAVFEPGLLDAFKWPHSVILEKEGPNDGLVSVASAKWGTYLGTLEGVNHLDLVGWINTARYKWAELLGREIKFKPATFYLGVADHLARFVEGQGKDANIGDTASTFETAEQSRAGEGAKTVEGVEDIAPTCSTSSHPASSSTELISTGGPQNTIK